jgi:hypothetical protein
MNPQTEGSGLAALQKTFGVTALGFGDPVVGFNVLGAMACTLANLAPDDGRVIDRNGRAVRLGTSLLVHGGASAGRVLDEIISEVSRRQEKLTSTSRTYLGWWSKNKENPHVAQSERKGRMPPSI